MKIPEVFVKDSEEGLEKLLQKKTKKKELIEKPRIGDGVYVPIAPYKDRPDEDCLVGWGKIGDVKETEFMKEKKYIISLEGRQDVWYDWNSLQKYQDTWALNYEALKRKYTGKDDPFPEFNC